ncbi:MAG: redox-sensing transcriptional repressor Rex [Gemmatimonadota bacterium]
MKKVSDSTVLRLSLYRRHLAEFQTQGRETVSSEDLASRAGTTAAQVRKDLSVFGTFGKRGLGYPVAELGDALKAILGLHRPWRVAVVGTGRIGAALMGYREFGSEGFQIEVGFDADPAKVGTHVHDVEVRSEVDLERELAERGIDIVIVAVPAAAAQAVVDRAVEAGIGALLNFAPVALEVPDGVALRNVNMAVELEGLSYALSEARRGRPGGAS